ncbi:hypothetical protein PpBr36_03259 [Pyricularia pennisetigena]|uniref:hypothetical protein n=1 Tax=Pyricularia pennisetigena TaxID=1578925 RepID=UPI00115435A4|nr:hypothetical protein PpBr36_03259 [Pyricularia pennisetigena]TLS30199.1 hypothetical protein PpBr36_03259 [Pyricularia pennisetigena]
MADTMQADNTEKDNNSDTNPQPSDNTTTTKDDKAAANKPTGDFKIDLEDALSPDPGTEDMFVCEDNRFAYSPGQLSKLLNPKSWNAFYAIGGLAGLEKGLQTNRKEGLSVDETGVANTVAFEDVAVQGAQRHGSVTEDLIAKAAKKHSSDGGNKSGHPQPPPMNVEAGSPFADRKRIFRDNRLPAKKSKSLLQIAWETYNDKILILLTFAAIISLALGLYQTFGVSHEGGGAKVEWVEGVAILVAIFIVVLVGTINDWQMQRSFNKLNAKHDDRHVKVIRSGKSVELSVYDILVGDVMHLETGDLVPVDGIFIQGHGVKCDESSATGESDLLKKTPADDVFAALQKIHEGKSDNIKIEKMDPFIISGSKVNEGTGTFLVTAVGVHSSYGRIMMTMQTGQESTPLQQMLNKLADMIAYAGTGSALLLFVVLFIKFLVGLPTNTDGPDQKGQTFLRLFITAVTVVVVAVPEGLPLAVTLALAFATTRMTKDNNLVRVLRACETMGNATTICSDKTGTLTQNKMTVVATTLGTSVSFGGTDEPLEEPESGQEKDQHSHAESTVRNVSVEEFSKSLSQAVKDILIQSNAVNSTAFEGDQDGEHTYIGSKTEVALLTFTRDHLGAPPVAEVRSNSDVVQVVPFDSALKYMATVVKLPDGKYRAYVKGASEILLKQCTRVLADPESEDLATTELTEELRETFNSTITSYAGQTLRTISSSYRDFDSWPPSEAASKEDPGSADFNKVHSDMTLVSIFGIKDPLRPGVVDAIKDCKRAGVVVRMVTGDNILTGRAIAKECGIYRPEEGGLAMEGPEFRRKSDEELKEIAPKLQVLARSSPEDKRILVKTLKELGETVAATGDGTNDAPALKMADIGFAMGIAGTEVAKEAAAIILMDDNFATIVKAMAWGRTVRDAVKKFLQFQLTVNVTAVVLVFVSAVSSATEESVLNAVQLLWVNLIMDTMAALALATDPPHPSVLHRKPDRKSAALITPAMAKMILGQAVCQLAITLVLNFGGYSLLGYDSIPDGEIRLKTLVFNTFVWLQIFNEVNNRRLDNKLNILEGVLKNYWFLGVNLIMIGGQVLIIFVGREAFKIVPLDGKEWGISIGLGAISIPWGMFIRLIPDHWILKLLPYAIRRRWVPETIKSEKELEKLKKDQEKDAEKAAAKKAKKDAKKEAKKAKKRAKKGGADEEKASTRSESDDEDHFKPPLRTLTSIRGNRARNHSFYDGHRGFHQYVHDQKRKVKAKAHTIAHLDSSHKEKNESVKSDARRSLTAPAAPRSQNGEASQA